MKIKLRRTDTQDEKKNKGKTKKSEDVASTISDNSKFAIVEAYHCLADFVEFRRFRIACGIVLAVLVEFPNYLTCCWSPIYMNIVNAHKYRNL